MLLRKIRVTFLSSAKHGDLLKHVGSEGVKLFDCFNSVQDGHFRQRMCTHKYVLIIIGEGAAAKFYRLSQVKEEITFVEAKKRMLLPKAYIEKIGEKSSTDSDESCFVHEKIPTPGNLEGRLLVRFISGQQNAPKFTTAERYVVTQVEPMQDASEFTNYKRVYLFYRELQDV